MSDEARDSIRMLRDLLFDMLTRALTAVPVKSDEGHLAGAAFVREFGGLYVQACEALLQPGDLSKVTAQLERKFSKAYIAMQSSVEPLPVVDQVERHMAARVKLLVKQQKEAAAKVKQNKLRLDAVNAARTR